MATDVFGRGIDIERINLAINYDLPADADSYLHRVGRAGRFGTKGLAISFVNSEQDKEVLQQIEKRFEVALPYVPVPDMSRNHMLTHPLASFPRRASTPPPTWPLKPNSHFLSGLVSRWPWLLCVVVGYLATVFFLLGWSEMDCMGRAQNENQKVVPCGPKLGHVKLDGLILGKCSLSLLNA